MTTDILVVGAGQAALALAYYLRALPNRFQLVDGNARVGDSWRNRYDSLRLFTPRQYSALPGRQLAGDPDGFPTKDEIADYLEDYASDFEFPVLHGCKITSLQRLSDRFYATTEDGRVIESRAVVLANGAFQAPAVPQFARELAPAVRQLSAAEYRRPDQVPRGNVLVVGDGATGRQIAMELAATHQTFLASGRLRRVSPQKILGRSIFWWMDRSGMLAADRESLVGRYLRRVDPFPGRQLETANLARHGVSIVPRLTHAGGTNVTFEDGREIEIQTIIWAIGYREDSSWVEIPEAMNQQHQLIHRRGITPVPGLFLLGRSWQTTRGSALLFGVARDARSIAEHLKVSLRIRSARQPTPMSFSEGGSSKRECPAPMSGSQSPMHRRAHRALSRISVVRHRCGNQLNSRVM